MLLAEIGQGYDVQSATQSRKNISAAYVEIDYKLGIPDSYVNNLMFKGKFDYLDSDYQTDPNSRYTLGVEWFIKRHFSIEGAYRFLREKPETDNDELLFLTHLWF